VGFILVNPAPPFLPSIVIVDWLLGLSWSPESELVAESERVA
jgi:hypothetical protein